MDGPDVAWMVVMRSSSDRFNRSDFSKALRSAACVGDIRNMRWVPVACGWEDFAGWHEKTFQGYANSCALHVSNVRTWIGNRSFYRETSLERMVPRLHIRSLHSELRSPTARVSLA